ncbi:lysostaphin resistance A-like protein [Methanosarcina sp. Mfa9]|uniref:CPBP family intramembrane glutamic endopeptidase n=1 Tax=Methanosarcina sp. Mfa9 TaxID=3439063 RepID=UPI003F853505
MASPELVDETYEHERNSASFLNEIDQFERKRELGKKVSENSEVQEEPENALPRHRGVLEAIPLLIVAFAELMIYEGSLDEAIMAHTLLLITLVVCIALIKDREIQRTYQILMLLPILRLVNLATPVFFEDTLYALAFIYAPMAIPVAIIAVYQEFTLEQMGLTLRRLWLFFPLAVSMGAVLGYGEYTILQVSVRDALIPDLSLASLLSLAIVMIFFVGLIEELIFRGLLQTRLESFLGPAAGILVASLLFGLMHAGYGSLTEILYAIFVGVFIGQLYYRTGDLTLVVLIHGFMNIFVFGIFPLMGL